ncbi:MAG: hypothetical protein U0W65_05040 [Bacteroidia bacterium]|nr:hypothetical protein [Bacteroidia bacterium]
MTKKLFIFLFVLSCGQAFSQKQTFDFTIHSRVDTTKQETKEIVAVWTNYLFSNPDSICDNPCWSEEDKKKYSDFDFTRKFIYQLPSKQLLNYYKPTILSVDKEGDNYAIRTLFNAEGLEGDYNKSNPWCITKLYAIKENNKWKLKNPLSILTQTWKRKTVGKINFIYPPDHQFNEILGYKANDFCDSIALKFQLPDWKPFDFYVTKSGDELGKLLGFDFFYTGYTTGMVMNEERILFSGFDSEWYPHEFVHLVVEIKKRHEMIDEGFATLLGGAGEKTFYESAKYFAQQLAKNETVKFDDILNKKWGWQFSAYYTTGAIVCKLIYDKNGITSVKKLLDTPPDNDVIKQTICKLLKIKTKDLDKYFRTETLKYLN